MDELRTLREKLLPQVEELINKKEEAYPGTIAELKEYLDTGFYWSDLPYYIVSRLVRIVYGDDVEPTRSRMEILFE